MFFSCPRKLKVAEGMSWVMNTTTRSSVGSTQKMVDDLKVTASKEAQLIIDEARAKADAAVQNGHNRLASIHEEIEALKQCVAQLANKR